MGYTRGSVIPEVLGYVHKAPATELTGVRMHVTHKLSTINVRFLAVRTLMRTLLVVISYVCLKSTLLSEILAAFRTKI